jgi:hypothetical protein
MHGHMNVKKKLHIVYVWSNILIPFNHHRILHCHEHEMYSVMLYVVLLWKDSHHMSDPSYHIWTRDMSILNPMYTCALSKLWLCLYLMLSWTNGNYMLPCGIYLTKECILFIKVQWNPVFSDDMGRGGVVLAEVQYSQYIVFLWQCSRIQGNQNKCSSMQVLPVKLGYCWNLVNISEQHTQ